SNYLETIERTKEECITGPNGERLIWAIPYRTEDIATMPGGDPEKWARCLVALDRPDCLLAPHTRSNHLGNAKGVVPLKYDWVLPHFPSEQEQRCVLRIRYNISTNDYNPKTTFSDQNGAESPIEGNPKVS
ncbi:hypothetical protein, partial [Salmonella sp. s54925]|uniref:hypothetical protein n=1 Tax=Salmonella sp. s54925 TaxID=3159674 RepID=UPI00397FC9ED